MYFSSTLIASFAALCDIVSASPVADRVIRRDCSSEVAAFNLARRAQHNARRSTYPFLLNTTCVLAPEAELENYIPNPPMRQNVTDDQVGIALTLDIGILDVSTCEALPNVMVEIWSANAEGEYGTFLRGASPAGSNGIVEFQTIFPGFTSQGANHINLMVHTTSLISSGVSHVGQIFFTDKWTTIIGMQPPYNTNTNVRVLDLDDPVYMAASEAGFYPVVE
ncbi:hypothetical protein E4T56_gene10322 [Termitomyces sp. T112]|nr:hypothetical protein E4T56_gene10322 [Termitomyces sp. T112]